MCNFICLLKIYRWIGNAGRLLISGNRAKETSDAQTPEQKWFTARVVRHGKHAPSCQLHPTATHSSPTFSDPTKQMCSLPLWATLPESLIKFALNLKVTSAHLERLELRAAFRRTYYNSSLAKMLFHMSHLRTFI